LRSQTRARRNRAFRQSKRRDGVEESVGDCEVMARPGVLSIGRRRWASAEPDRKEHRIDPPQQDGDPMIRR
jgi:hypothetical protein